MPFTSPHLYDEEDARDKAAAALLAQQSQQASGQLTDALGAMQARADKAQQIANQQAQIGVENKRADAQLALSTANTNDEIANRGALRLNDAARTKIATDSAAAEEAARNEATREKQGADQSRRVGGMATDYFRNGALPSKSMEEFTGQLVGQPGYEQLHPEDVQHLYEGALASEKKARVDRAIQATPGDVNGDIIARIAADTGATPDEIKAAAQAHALALQAAKDPAADRKSRENIAYSEQANARRLEEMRGANALATEKARASDKPPNANVVEGLAAKRVVADAADVLSGMLDNPNVNLEKIKLALQAQDIIRHGGQLKGNLEDALSSLNPDEQAVSSQMGIIKEKSGLATTGGKRVTPEGGMGVVNQMTGISNTNKAAVKAGLKQYAAGLRADYDETSRALPKEASALGAGAPPAQATANKDHADSYFGGG